MVRIPAGAMNIDIKQVSYSGKPEDDNYLGECTSKKVWFLKQHQVKFKSIQSECGGSPNQSDVYITFLRFSSHRSMPLPRTWPNTALTRWPRAVKADVNEKGVELEKRAKLLSNCFQKWKEKDFFSLFLLSTYIEEMWGALVEGKQMECQPLRKINEAAISAN